MTALLASSTSNIPDTALAHAITMATLITEAAVKIGTTSVRPGAIAVREFTATAPGWEVEVQVDTTQQVDEVGAVFRLPLIDYAEKLYTRARSGVSLAGHLVTVRVYSGRRA
jgi:hypothetical protein